MPVRQDLPGLSVCLFEELSVELVNELTTGQSQQGPGRVVQVFGLGGTCVKIAN